MKIFKKRQKNHPLFNDPTIAKKLNPLVNKFIPPIIRKYKIKQEFQYLLKTQVITFAEYIPKEFQLIIMVPQDCLWLNNSHLNTPKYARVILKELSKIPFFKDLSNESAYFSQPSSDISTVLKLNLYNNNTDINPYKKLNNSQLSQDSIYHLRSQNKAGQFNDYLELFYLYQDVIPITRPNHALFKINPQAKMSILQQFLLLKDLQENTITPIEIHYEK